MRQVGLYLLGHFEVHLNGTQVETFRCSKMKALLAYLAVESKRPHRREALAELFWPERSSGVARTNLRQALLGIRQAVQDHDAPSPLLEITVNTIQLNRSSSYLADIDTFEGQFRAIRTHIHENLVACLPCMGKLEAAADLYRGDFLDGMSFDEESEFDQWVQFHRRYYFRRQLEALQHLADHYRYLNQYDTAYQYALRQVKMEPVKESAHRQIMSLFSLTGQRSAAIEQYRICCRNLANELGVEPEPETVALFEQIKAGAVIKNEARFP